MNTYEQVTAAIEKEIEALRNKIEERQQLVSEQASVEFPMYWYRSETSVLERKLNNLEQSLMWLTSDVYLGNEEEQAKRNEEAPKEEAAAKARQQNKGV